VFQKVRNTTVLSDEEIILPETKSILKNALH
jgi:hypothetical protein